MVESFLPRAKISGCWALCAMDDVCVQYRGAGAGSRKSSHAERGCIFSSVYGKLCIIRAATAYCSTNTSFLLLAL